jgi:hypothetical protein
MFVYKIVYNVCLQYFFVYNIFFVVLFTLVYLNALTGDPLKVGWRVHTAAGYRSYSPRTRVSKKSSDPKIVLTSYNTNRGSSKVP